MKKGKMIGSIGIPASGKSTLALELEAQGVRTVSRDRYRRMPELFEQPYKLTKEREKLVTEKRNSSIQYFIDQGIDVFVDETNCSNKSRDSLINLSKELNCDIEWVIMPDSFNVDLCHKRNTQREHSVPFEVIENMFVNFLDFVMSNPEYCPDWLPTKEDVMNSKKTDFIIVDVDGTIAKRVNRSPYEWSKVSQDEPIQEVIDVIELLSDNYFISVFSGRDGSCKEDTEQWIYDWCKFDPSEIFLRPEGSIEKDYIVKMRMLKENFTRYGTLPWCVFDDRLQVVRYWRAIGLKVFQVDSGLF